MKPFYEPSISVKGIEQITHTPTTSKPTAAAAINLVG
jgi:hypothetical protein